MSFDLDAHILGLTQARRAKGGIFERWYTGLGELTRGVIFDVNQAYQAAMELRRQHQQFPVYSIHCLGRANVLTEDANPTLSLTLFVDSSMRLEFLLVETPNGPMMKYEPCPRCEQTPHKIPFLGFYENIPPNIFDLDRDTINVDDCPIVKLHAAYSAMIEFIEETRVN